MCGIAGYIGQIERQKFEICLNTLSHRGPDGWDVWQSEKAMLGHRRLAIIDLSERGRQPFEILDRYIIILNGEIYNYKELRKELEAKGIKFYSDSDTEVLAYSYVTWGAECVNRLNGMWAFAIWDKQEKSLFLSRDRMGKKPLFYIHGADFFAFASEMKALYPLLEKVEIDYELVEKAKQDVFCYENTSRCLIKNIERFPAGSNATLNNNRIVINRYWEPLDTIHNVPSDYNQQVEQFRDLFIDACRIRMRSDVTVGTALSGGLDSSATISSMAWIGKNIQHDDYNHDWQHAFVASFPGSSIDETKFAKKVVDHIGITATYLPIDPLKDIDKLTYYSYMFEELYLTSPLPFIQLYRQIKENGTTVTLDGHGSDELFGGYPFDIFSKLEDDFPNPFRMHNTVKTFLDGTKQTYNAISAWRHTMHHYRHFIKNRNNDQKQPIIKGLGSLNTQLYKSSFETILPTLLRNYDRYSMINGVEIRMPFLDHRIVSFAFSIPPTSKVRKGFTKAIVRDAMKGLMPDEIAYRKDKIGFNAPFADWLRGPLKTWVRDITAQQSFKESKLVDHGLVKEKIKKVIDAPHSDFIAGEKAWISLMPYFWEQSLQYAKRFSPNSPVRI